jgi:hypothetical protein
MFTSNTSKATAALLGGGFGNAFSMILVWLLNSYALTDPLPTTIEGAINIVVTGLIAWITTYLSPANTP